MACNPSNELSGLSMDQGTYLSQQLSPQSRPADFFDRADPLAANWSYNNAIDMFALDPADMEPVSFDFPDSLTDVEPKSMFSDPFATSGVSGFTMPICEEETPVSSEFDIDKPTFGLHFSPQAQSQTQTQSSSTEWSSTPYMKDEETLASQPSKINPTSRKTRSFSRDSNHSSTSSQDPQTRNAAKRAAHNVIEKRYRTNMNAKFVSLEQAISPSGVRKPSKLGTGSLKKSEILTNALAYIDSIQQENQALHRELALLKQNMMSSGMWHPGKNPRLS
ncbi:uncharacterized protein N7515_006102 [Penicillium bovifimosum]|uniref:BHLH domain-containing protein n=1 Tax=Penicillium bovifimosum TaxID=126998 RepID=A0A9W9GUB4_9EURO|nr:uncharacterized protein N7515_006102 [Penicillium bovifimosum]KAJ5130063.1 hypothetical protein N7515_006102 [Penicillium bovifimosum]